MRVLLPDVRRRPPACRTLRSPASPERCPPDPQCPSEEVAGARVRHPARRATSPRPATSPTTWCANASEHPDAVVVQPPRSTGAGRTSPRRSSSTRCAAVAKGLVAAGSSPATGSRCCPGPATSGRCSTTRSGTPARSPCRSTRPRRPSRSRWILSDSGARGRRRRDAGAPRPDRGRPRTSSTSCSHVWSLDDGAVDVLTRLGRGRRRRRARGAPRAAAPDSPGDPDLHLGHDRPAQGLHAHPRQLHVRARRGHRGARRAVRPRRRRASTLLFLPLAHVFARIIQVGVRQDAGPARPLRRHQEPRRRPRGVPADVHPGRAPGLREGLQHRSQRAAADGRGKVFDRAADVAIAYSRALDTGRSRLPVRGAAPASSTGWSTPGCAQRSAAGAVRHLRRRAARRAARPLLPRHRGHGPRGLRPDRDHRGGDREPARRA